MTRTNFMEIKTKSIKIVIANISLKAECMTWKLFYRMKQESTKMNHMHTTFLHNFYTLYFEQVISPSQHSFRIVSSWPLDARCLRPDPPPGMYSPHIKICGT